MKNLTGRKIVFSILAISFIFLLYTQNSIADTPQDKSPYSLLGNILPKQGPKETYMGMRLGSYKPDLRQLNAILEELNARAPGADTMFTIFASFKNRPLIEYLLEAGYWENEASVKSATSEDSEDINTSLIHISFSFLYYPKIIQEYLPLYFGAGAGIYKMDIDYGNIEAVKTAMPDDRKTELGGNMMLGMKRVVRDRILLDIRINHVFKNFTVNEKNNGKLSFDGTDLSIGASIRF